MSAKDAVVRSLQQPRRLPRGVPRQQQRLALAFAFLQVVTAARNPQPGRGRVYSSLPRSRDADYDGLKIYVYELPDLFHEDLVAEMEEEAKAAGSNCDFMLSACTEKRHVGDFSTARQWGAEVVILRKFLANPNRVYDPEIADVFVVPYLAGTACRLGGHHIRCTTSLTNAKIFKHLPHYNLAKRHRHLFLASMDAHSLPLVIQAQQLFVSYGALARDHPGNVIVPPSVAEAEFQPGTFEDVPLEKRDLLFWLAQTPNNAVRFLLQRQLIAFDEVMPQAERERLFGLEGQGRILVHVMGRNKHNTSEGGAVHGSPSPKSMLEEMKRAVFCPAPPAENSAAGTKRFFDVLLAGCIPVVISFSTVWGSGVSWWRRDGAPIEWAMPFPWEIDWRRLVVEVPIEDLERDNQFVKKVLLVSQEEREAKRRYLLEVRDRLVYDFQGGTRDAFSLFMDGLRAALKRLEAVSTIQHASYLPGAPGSVMVPGPVVCDSSARGLDFYRLPSDFGHGSGHDKAWAHTNGELSCRPAALWQRIAAGIKEDGYGGAPEHPVIAERFFTNWSHISEFGIATFVQALSSSPLPVGQEGLILSKASMAFCTHQVWPMACHDKMQEDDNELVLTLCSKTPYLNAPSNSTCRMLPALTPQLPSSRSLGIDAMPVHWQLVTWACNITLSATGHDRSIKSFASEWEQSWKERMPLNHLLSIVVYEVCTPDATADHKGGRNKLPTSAVILEHLLAVAHARRRGEPVADALLLLPDQWMVPWQTTWGWTPHHFLNMVHMLLDTASPSPLEDFGNGSRAQDRWLVILDGPDPENERTGYGTWGLCEKHASLLSTGCVVPKTIMESSPQAIAFPSHLLDNESMLVDLEATVAHRDGETKPSKWEPTFNFAVTMLVDLLDDTQVRMSAFR
eukprot:TRINITY_DN123535_c0_g1_i1.p1 TRINITY_DN123535_c0_g1~~TRINITY_DN123535_c0_g1_i1.p1  ORF type:complete len:905 (-),score=169.00 TRINITY_DN123535_c0_g1_i1:105-2819(-)